MADVIFVVVVIIGFFALCAAFVVGCDRIVRSGDDVARAGGLDGGDAVSAENVIGLVLSVLLLGYLVAAFIVPERF